MLAALGDYRRARNDARAMLQVGKTALGRGLRWTITPFRPSASPNTAVGPALERSMVYSVARTESSFDQRDSPHANAVGLMQVTPEAGKDTAKRFGVSYDWNRMVTDPRLQHADGRRRAVRAADGIQGLADHDLRRLQCRPRPRARLGQGSSATRAIPRSMRSTGSSASRSRRRATTFSA